MQAVEYLVVWPKGNIWKEMTSGDEINETKTIRNIVDSWQQINFGDTKNPNKHGTPDMFVSRVFLVGVFESVDTEHADLQ